ncbi:unnamed protein product [Cuscuta epithymum]|uniref:Protein kinase domain-containing protein n=1 Tax=Cuscuta epithymum TaxID=186058 RepID=A0AAV0FY77_9ASTE|nr:unnamed protein product [Cuscuta epithymum]CAH9140604.1 unnamed protein product [Cuscuta epithymum]
MENYEVMGQIGKGSFGSALLVRHRQENKKYVLKKIRLARQTERNRRSAHLEMELMARARNPYIVEYKDSWVEKGCYVCIVIGYCEGGDVGDAIKRANGTLFSEEKLCQWLVQLLMALDYLHSNRILHRDVKCSNIFLTKDHNIRLGDFGLAKVLFSGDLTTSVVGTPSYMCPELLADIPYGSKSDIWSLGCCMYEMTAHRPAFKAFDMQGLISKINKCIVAPMPTIYSGALRGLIKSMLRRNPELRPSAASLLKHSHLQPYVMKMSVILDSPRRHTLPAQSSDLKYAKKTRRVEGSETVHVHTNGGRRSFCSNRALNPSISGTELDSHPLSQDLMSSSGINRSEPSVGSNVHDTRVKKTTVSKLSTAIKTARSSSNKTSAATIRGQSTALKISNPGLTRELHPVAVNKPTPSKRRASLPLPTKTPKVAPPINPAVGQLNGLESQDVSMNAPRINKMVDSRSPSSPSCDSSVTKDKCTVQQKLDDNTTREVRQDESEGSSYNPRRFDTSSYKQRAEALEGLLEFSAQLLQQERIDELWVLLKPFGPENVSPRETAIWLTKSIMENAA